MNPRVRGVQATFGHRLLLTFTNGEKGVFDCRPLLEFGVFRELQDEAYFRQARVEGGTVVWPHEQDICPDTLYLESDKSAAVIAKHAVTNDGQPRFIPPGSAATLPAPRVPPAPKGPPGRNTPASPARRGG